MKTTEQPIVTRASSELVDVSDAALPALVKQQQQQQNPFVVAHGLLRGRYRLAITLGVIGLIIGGVGGYLLKHPVYQSTGILSVSPVMPRAVFKTEDNNVMPMFDAFVVRQAELLQSRRVVEEAMNYPQWGAMGRPYSPQALDEFLDKLRVEPLKGAALIRVMFSDEDPKAAALAVRSIIESYDRIYRDSESEGSSGKLDYIEQYERELQRQLNDKNASILNRSAGFGPAYLQQVWDHNIVEQLKLESEIRAVERQLRQAGVDVRNLASTQPPATTARANVAATVPLEAIALRDPYLQSLRSERLKVDMQLRLDAGRFGDKHPSVIEARRKLDIFDEQVKERVAELQKGQDAMPLAPAPDSPHELSVPRLLADYAVLQRQHSELKSGLEELGKTQQDIAKLQMDATEIQDKLNTTKKRRDEITVEKSANVRGRINAMSYGDVPVTPFTDPRRKLTVFGAFGLCAAGVGFVLLLGFLDRRMRHIDAARAHLNQVERMLGVIPELPTGMNDPAQSTSAAYCIHQIRAMLQIRQRATGHKLFAITSPSPGDGKTSLTTALGMSLATSGQRTVVVDCDIEGAALSAMISRTSGANNIERANAPSGDLHSALHGEPLDRCVRPTGCKNLSVLPLRGSQRANIGRIAPESLRRLFDALSQQFDVVLVDCGPVLGSIEAAIVAAEADGVVLVVSRGGNRATAEAAVRLLQSAGAEVEGIVFNRAEATDIARSRYHSSSSQRSARSRTARAEDQNSVDKIKFE